MARNTKLCYKSTQNLDGKFPHLKGGNFPANNTVRTGAIVAMQFTRKGDFLCASQITGPRHNYIEILVSTGAAETPKCECLSAIGNCKHEPLSEPEIIKHVQHAITEANTKYNKNYCVTHIRYVENDTRPEIIYGVLTSKIIAHLENGGVFNVAVIPTRS